MNVKFYPSMRFEDSEAALVWLHDAFGFRERSVYRDEEGTLRHAEMSLGDETIMFGDGDPATGNSVYVAVDDLDALYERAKAAGAEVTRELQDTDYDSREFSVRDLAGHAWHFGTYRP